MEEKEKFLEAEKQANELLETIEKIKLEIEAYKDAKI